MTAAPNDPDRIAVHAAVIPTGAVAAPSSQTRGVVPAAAGALVSAAELAQVTPDHRQEPAVVLHRGSAGLTAQARSRRLRPAALIRVCSAAGAAFLLAWIVVLGATLPAQAVTHEWKLAWLGLDVAEAAGLLVMTWAARRQREMLILATIVTGTLLACDAWFDLVLSWGTSDWRWSVLSAVALELPLAALLFAAARQMIRTRVAELDARMRPAGPAATDRRLARLGPPAQCPGRRGRSRRPGRTAGFSPRTASRASGGVQACSRGASECSMCGRSRGVPVRDARFSVPGKALPGPFSPITTAQRALRAWADRFSRRAGEARLSSVTRSEREALR